MADLPIVVHRQLETPYGPAVGAAYEWAGGQYCAIHTHRGVIGCGIYDIDCADEFGMAFAIAKGTPEQPLRQPEDLYDAQIVAVSTAAGALGILIGMTGREALYKMLESSVDDLLTFARS